MCDINVASVAMIVSSSAVWMNLSRFILLSKSAKYVLKESL